MNALLVLTGVPSMLLVSTLREGTTAHVTLDSMEMDFPAIVFFLFSFFPPLFFISSSPLNYTSIILLQILMSVVM